MSLGDDVPMTVADLKAIISIWPDNDADGEPLEVWLSDRRGLTNELMAYTRLGDGALLLMPRQDPR